MTEHTITLSESTYRLLMEEVQAKGMSPNDWIAAELAATAALPKPSAEFPEDLIGSIDSGAEPEYSDDLPPARTRDLFGEAVIEKMARQGIHLPSS